MKYRDKNLARMATKLDRTLAGVYKVKSATNGTGIRTYRVSKRGKVRFRVRVKTLSEMEPHAIAQAVCHARARLRNPHRNEP